MYRCVALVGRMVAVVAIILSFAVTRPAAAEGLNTLTFSFSICPEWEDTCTPYGNTDARIMELATGIEQWTTNDAQGRATFAGLADGQYTFSAPAVQQKSISITCGDDATGMIVGSQMGDNGPQVGLAGGQSVTCSGVMVPFGPADADEAPADPGVAVDVPQVGYVNAFIYECPAGAEGQPLNTICDSPSQTYTASLTSGTVPNQTTVQQATNSAGAAYFIAAPGTVALWPGTDSSTQTIVSSGCVNYVTGDDGLPVGTEFQPALGGAGYEVPVTAGGSVECFFYLVPVGGPTVDQADTAILSIYTSECPAGYSGGDYASDCGNPVDASIYTAFVGYGTVPNSTTLESALNDYGYATFGGLAGDHYSVMVGSDSAVVGAVSCQIFDASGSGEGTWIDPPLGGRGYELDLVAGGSADCYVAMVPAGEPTPSTSPVASDEPVVSDEPAASDEPVASDEPAASASDRPSAQPSTGGTSPTSLPNTGTGAAATGGDGGLTVALFGMVIGAALLLVVVLTMRRPSRR